MGRHTFVRYVPQGVRVGAPIAVRGRFCAEGGRLMDLHLAEQLDAVEPKRPGRRSLDS